MSCVQYAGIIYPEFRSRTPPPTYTASMLDYGECRRPRRFSFDCVETFPGTSISEAVEPVPATPPPVYRGRGTVHGMPAFCPRALRSRPLNLVVNDSISPATPGTDCAVVASGNPSSELVRVGKWMQGIGRCTRARGSLKPDSSDAPATSESHLNDDHHAAGCSSNNS